MYAKKQKLVQLCLADCLEMCNFAFRMKDIIEKYLSRTGFNRLEPRAALFDMDGVLYDSMRNHAKAWHESMEEFGIKMSEMEAYLYEGMRGVETIKLITKQQCGEAVSETDAEEMYRVKSLHYSACPQAEIIPGVRELQKEMMSHGMKIGVVTGSGQASLLQRILNDFDGIVSPDIMVSAHDIEHGKPAPDPYIKGMKKAGTEPWQTIVVENAPLGVRAGVAAKCFTVAVNTGPLPDEALEREGADVVFQNMEDVRRFLADYFAAG